MHLQRLWDGMDTDAFAKLCATIFLATGLPAIVLLCFLTAPFGVADEPAHLLRAATLSGGAVLPQVAPAPAAMLAPARSAGGLVDGGIAHLAVRIPWEDIWEHRGEPSRALMRDAARVPITGRRVYAAHSNTAIYPPLLYAGSALGCVAARLARLPALGWLYAGRLVNALLAGFTIWLAVRRGGPAAPFLLLAATMPTVLFETASLSADALLFANALLFAALIARLAFQAPFGGADLVALAIATAMVGAGKVAYAPLAILPPAAMRIADRGWSRRACILAGCSVATLCAWASWAWLVHAKVFSIRSGVTVDPMRQLSYVLAHPGATAGLILRTLTTRWLQLARGAFGGVLGWNEFGAPEIVFRGALPVLAAAAFLAPRRARPLGHVTALAVALAIGCAAGIFLLLYLQFNAPGATSIVGVQGRYLTPLAILIGAVTPRRQLGTQLKPYAALAVPAWAAFSCAMTLGTVIARYWF